MKKWLILLAAIVLMLIATGCGNTASEVGEDGLIRKYTYYSDGNIESMTTYDAQKICLAYFLYTYHENGNVKTVEVYSEKGSQKQGYDVYDEEHNLILSEIYRYNNSTAILSSSIEYKRNENGRVLSTTRYSCGQTNAEFFASMGIEGADEFPGYYKNPEWIHTDYYENGYPKEAVRYEVLNGDKVLCGRDEYIPLSNLEEYIYAFEEHSSGSTTVTIGPTLNGEQKETLGPKVIDNGDGTYSQYPYPFSVTSYSYYPNGDVSSVTHYDENGSFSTESYYENGVLEYIGDRTRYLESHGWKHESYEYYYESGGILKRESVKYREYAGNQVDSNSIACIYYYAETFYESGEIKSVAEYDAEAGINSYTVWNKEGNEIESDLWRK